MRFGEIVMSPVAPRTYTPEDLLKMQGGDDYELINGRLVDTANTARGAWIAGQVMLAISQPGGESRFGYVFSSRMSYQCFPNAPKDVLHPDVSLIEKGRLTEEQFVRHAHCPIPPDLAVEVVSPRDRYYDVEYKVAAYLSAGVRLVWVINPHSRKVRVLRLDGTVRQLNDKDELTGDGVLSGFCVQVGSLFPPAELTSIQ